MLRNSVPRWFLLLATLSGLGLPFAQGQAESLARASYHDVELAYPRVYSDSIGKRRLPGGSASVVKVVLEISRKGRVNGVEADWPHDLKNKNPLDSLLRQIEFVPGQVEGKTRKQSLLVKLYYVPTISKVQLVFPVDSLGAVEDVDLYWASLKSNGVSYPEIKMMPFYFFPFDFDKSQRMFPYLLTRLSFDSSAGLSETEVIHSDAGNYTDQLLTAMNWASFELPELERNKQVSAYLIIALYDLVAYPTKNLLFPLDSVDMANRYRVRLAPDTVGLMFKPLPRRYNRDGRYTLFGCGIKQVDTLGVRLSIDTAGNIMQFKVVGAFRETLNCFLKFATKFKFYPALDFQGKAQPFEGMMRFEYVDSKNIRIRFCWIPGEPGWSSP